MANAKNRESKNEKPNNVWATKNTINKVPIDSGNATIIEILPIDSKAWQWEILCQ